MKEAVKTLVPDAAYTDRQEFIDYFYNYALEAGTRRAMSTVLLGRRRMGKTEIFKRVVNRLFFGQDHTDAASVVPVWYIFPDEATDPLNFALDYVENFIRWYAAFRTGDPTLISGQIRRRYLIAHVRDRVPISPGFAIATEMLEALMADDVTLPEKKAIMLPRMVSDIDDSTVIMFLDEFQNTHLPHHNFRVAGFMQEAVESPTCPHFVTGSAMSVLAREILGRGALFGRFRSKPIEPLSKYWGAELARRAAVHYQADITDLSAPIIANRCGGNPFYITAVIRQAAEKGLPIRDEETINNLLAVDLSSGFIWAELNDQVTQWIRRTNRHGITKWVMYLSALEEDERIRPERIQQQLLEKEGSRVSVEVIRDVLVRLSRGDLLEYMELGGWFRKSDDPILLDFLKIWGRFEIEGRHRSGLVTDIIKEYDTMKRRFSDQKGYLAEVYLSQFLWNGQGKTFPGMRFHSDEDVTLPDRFYNIRSRLRLDASAESEADIYASAGTEIWLCESKWWETSKVGQDVVKDFLGLAEKLKDFEGREYFERERPLTVRLWLFAHNGVTPKAETLLCEHGMYWSDRSDIDALIKLVGLRKLPR